MSDNSQLKSVPAIRHMQSKTAWIPDLQIQKLQTGHQELSYINCFARLLVASTINV
jgi:hypothetical protein